MNVELCIALIVGNEDMMQRCQRRVLLGPNSGNTYWDKTTNEWKALGDYLKDTFYIINKNCPSTTREGIVSCSVAKIWWAYSKVQD